MQLIQRHLVYLSDVIDIQAGLLDNLIAEHVIDSREADDIKSEPTNDERNVNLLMKLQTKSPLDFDLFLSALEKNNQEHVADVLRVEINTSGGL